MYAESTSVPVDRSQTEIKKILSKYGATSFAFAEGQGNAMLMFEMKGRRIVFKLPLPIYHKTKNQKGYVMGQKETDQLTRTKWRCLVLAIKAKLECVESGITTIEQEFLAHIVLPNGQTVGEAMIPQIAMSYERKEMPPLLGMKP